MMSQSFGLTPSRIAIFLSLSFCNVLICAEDTSSTKPYTSEDFRRIADGFVSSMEVSGYDVREGSLKMTRPFDDCWDHIDLGELCKYPNPNSKYNIPIFPYIEGEYIDEEHIADTLEMHRIRGDEALILMSKTPPKSNYFGYTHYVGYRTNFTDDGPIKTEIHGTLDDTLNPWNVKVHRSTGTMEESFNKDLITVCTPHRDVYEAIKNSLIQQGVSPDIINLQAIPRALFTWGLGEHSDTIYFLNRILDVADKTEEDAYFNDTPGIAFRVTPKVEMEVTDPYDLPIRMKPFMNTNEKYLEKSFDILEESLMEYYGPSLVKEKRTIYDKKIYQNECINAKLDTCCGLSDDTTYFVTFGDYPFTEDNFALVVGANNVLTNTKATASTLTVYNKFTEAPIGYFDSDFMTGTANSFLDESVEFREQFYVVMLRRNCDGYENCIELPYGKYGVDAEHPTVFYWRVILHHLPGMVAAPHKNLLYPRIYNFQPSLNKDAATAVEK